MPPKPLEFWFEFASTYSYPAAMRVDAMCREANVPLIWRPFLLGPVFAHHGMTDSPFNTNPVKGAYMWRDLERVCKAQKIPFRQPSVFPRGSVLATRIVAAYPDAAWIGGFIRAIYTANFAHDADIGQRSVVSECLEALGVAPGAVIEHAQSSATKTALRAQTENAITLGLFGAPSMIVDSELFWGNDRLEVALEHATALR